jgi:alginate O-acetyltransferase complex protein AlgI
MIFNETSYYLLFLLPSVTAFHLVSRGENATFRRSLVLTAFGLLFFGYYGYLHFGGWRGSLVVLLLGWELATSQLYRPGSRFCLWGVVQAILILFVFKYLGFFSGVISDLGGAANVPAATRLVLPLGISFFTFEFIHFAVESYRGTIRERPPWTYAAFIFFFPSMIAGPIKRYGEFLPELRNARFDPELTARGVTRILVGLVKKHAIADSFSLFSDRLSTDALYSAPRSTVAAWLLAYGMKIYFDFSGYSDIAIGSGYLFGIKLPENFAWPYLSRNITEFWRRWHISLGRFIFDYVYAPLGGSRRGEGRVALNLMVTFAVSGLWHGAAYNFLLWGLWHGLMMVVHRLFTRHMPPFTGPLWSAFSTALTFACVCVGWAFFCMPAGRAVSAIARIVGLS